MHRRRTFALGGATLALALTPAVALAAKAGGGKKPARGPAVTIRIEGLKKTLLLATVVHTHGGFITRSGAPPKACPGNTAQGALDVATHGKWSGTWNAQFREYFITSILGEKPKGSNYWEIFVGNKFATAGACDLKLHHGEQLLFADGNGPPPNPSGVVAPHSAIKGKPFTAKVVGYTAGGKATPLAGVVVTGNGVKASKTNSQGVATITDSHAGVLVLHASPRKYLRSEAIVHVAA
jgi:hypothetical protein